MSRAYVFLTALKPLGLEYEAYRESRSTTLLAYCHGIKLRFPHVTEAIGIASEPFSEMVASQDFLYVDLTHEISSEEISVWNETMEELDVLQTPVEDVKYFGEKGHEFPLPFNFGGPNVYENVPSVTVNRAERRRMAREARKDFRKPKMQKR